MVEPIRFTFHLETRAKRELAFRALSDTDSFNQLARAGMTFESVEGPDGPRVLGTVGKLGMTIRWEERPFSFRAPSWFRIQRDFQSGPAARLTARAQLESLPGGGTAMRYQLEVLPKSVLLRPVLSFDLKRTVEPHLRTALAQVVAFLDARAGEDLDELDTASLAPPPALSKHQERTLVDRLSDLPPTPLRERLVAFIRAAPMRDQLTMSALTLAQAWSSPLSDVAELFVRALSVGVLGVRLDLLCPACLVPKAQLRGSAPVVEHCDTCNIRLDATFAEALAIHFFPSPDIRDVRPKIECFGSPARTPQIVAQDFVPSGGSVDLAVPLLPGTYQLRAIPAAGPPALISVRELDTTRALELRIGTSIHPQLCRAHPALESLVVHNDTAETRVAVLERVLPPRKVMSLGRMMVEFPELAALVPFSGFLTSVNVFFGAALALRASSEDDARDLIGALSRARVARSSDLHVLALYADVDGCVADLGATRGRWALAGVAYGQCMEGRIGKNQIPAGPAVDRAYDAMRVSAVGDCSLSAADAEYFTRAPEGWRTVAAGDLVHWEPASAHA
jgi:hypothetical protein